MDTDRNITVTVIVIIVLCAGWFFSLRLKEGDVNFSRGVFSGLISGRCSVQKHIDWEGLKAVGVDVGESYLNLPDDQEKADYRRTFIESFAASFRRAGARLSSFKNWRVYEKKEDSVIVAADCRKSDKTILFTFSSKDGGKKLAAIQWENADGR